MFTNILLNLCLVIFIIFIFQVAGAYAQSSNAGTTPAGIAPGSPSGSHSLSGFETVNPYNGNLNFSLPLHQVIGRGGMAVPIRLTINQKWVGQTETDDYGNGPQTFPYAEYQWWNEWFWKDKGYGPGRLTGRRTGLAGSTCPGIGWHQYSPSLTRLTFTTPDGTEYDLVDDAHKGKPLDTGYCNPGPTGASRGTVFVTTGGHAVTFISDTTIYDNLWAEQETRLYPSGYLMMPDGTRYRIDEGKISWQRDRNGNKITFTYESGGDFARLVKITDSLNREVTFEYEVQDVSPYGLCDRINYKGFGGAQRTIRISYKSLRDVLRSGYTIKTGQQLFPEIYQPPLPPNSLIDQLAQSEYVVDKVAAVWLPDGIRSYQLRYNSYGELARVELPTGGAIEYDWVNAATLGSGRIAGLQQWPAGNVYRRVVERRLYTDGNTLETKMTLGAPEWLTEQRGYVLADQYGANGALLNRVKHYYYGIYHINAQVVGTNAFPFYQSWRDAQEYQTDFYDSDGSTVLRSIAHTWNQTPPYWYSGPAYYAPSNNARIDETTTILSDTNQASKQTFAYDQYQNLTDTYDYDYGTVVNGVVVAGALLRRTHIDYLTTNPVNNQNYALNNIHIRNLPAQQWISSDAAGNNKQSLAIYEYDNYASNATHAALVSRADISGLCTTFDNAGQCANTNPTAYTTRGNVTSVTNHANAANQTGAVTVASQYDVAGNAVKIFDAKSIASQQYYASALDYTDRFGLPDEESRADYTPPELSASAQHSYAFATSVTNPLSHTSYSQYSYYLGEIINSEDINGVVSSSYFADLLDRPTQIVLAANIPALRQQKHFIYDDAGLTVTVISDLRNYGDGLLKHQSIYNGLGALTETRAYENGTDYIATKVIPNALLQHPQTNNWVATTQTSDPYRQGEQPIWTTSFFDALGRVSIAQSPDNAQVKTAYSGNQTTVTDQAGRQRKSLTDALGRLTAVYESPANYNYQTSYSYDTLGNLRTVVQGTSPQLQTRQFVYNSLSQLTSAANPESGLVTYGYDENGNLLTKTDARGTVITYGYDLLNRNVSRTYSGGTAVSTPPVTYTYDAIGIANSKGRLTSVSSSLSTYNYSGYDALGRVTASQQITDGKSYAMSYSYDLTGNMVSQTYPTGRVVMNNFDSMNRLSNVSGQASGGTPKTYANSFIHTAHGAVKGIRLGNGRWEHVLFNNRLQPVEIGLGTSTADSSVLKLQYDYGTTQNNGNLLRQTINVPGTTGFVATQHYKYDPELNRLTGVQEVNGNSPTWQASGSLWQQLFTFDRFGNRAVDTADTTSTLIGPNPQISSTDNRITPRAGEFYEYDPAGNLKKGKGGESFNYNGDNRLAQYQGGATQVGGVDYFYDGDGRRVKKANPSATTIFVYNALGQLIAEFTTGTPQNNGTNYLTNDILGTPRVIAKADGSIRFRHDHLPFGEQLYAGTGSRTTGLGYDDSLAQANQTRQKFTSYERDFETGLDYAQHRYYANAAGRFVNADPTLLSVAAINPQTWNRYSYTLNNPLVFTDPTGLWTYEADPQYAKNADGTPNREKIIGIRFLLVKEKGDNAASLANQLNISEKDAQKIINKLGDGNLRLSEAGGIIGSVFKEVEAGLKVRAQNQLKGLDGDANGWDCSRTTWKIGFGAAESQLRYGTNSLDKHLAATEDGRPLNARSLGSQSELKVGDIVRYAMGGGATHFANFIFFDNNQTPIVFSKSGGDGPYEVGTARRIGEQNDYGSVQPLPGTRDKTGFYRSLRR